MSGGRRFRAAVLGATGVVGQELVRLLEDHPWFELAVVAASPRTAGQPYGQAVHWLADEPLGSRVARMEVAPASELAAVDVVFSALDARVAREIEPLWRNAGVPVVSNASAFRWDPRAPLLVPEVNEDHLELVREAGQGFVVTNPNCATAGLVLALAPLHRRFGVVSVALTTLQAVSGAGYPGVASLDILDNVLPLIPGEEPKLETEATRILGELGPQGVEPAPITISAQSIRVPVTSGHLLSLSIRTRSPVDPGEAREALEAFGRSARRDLPTSPDRVLRVFGEGPVPQPRRHAGLGGGMTVSVGRLRRCAVADLRCVVLVHNTMRGAAGAALLNAELLAAEGLLRDRP